MFVIVQPQILAVITLLEIFLGFIYYVLCFFSRDIVIFIDFLDSCTFQNTKKKSNIFTSSYFPVILISQNLKIVEKKTASFLHQPVYNG